MTLLAQIEAGMKAWAKGEADAKAGLPYLPPNAENESMYRDGY